MLEEEIFVGQNGGEVFDSLLHIHSDHADGSIDIVDSSPYGRTLTLIGDVKHSTEAAKFGASSIKFDGASAVSMLDTVELYFGNSDFTIAFFFKKSVQNTTQFMIGQASVIGGAWGFSMLHQSNNRLDCNLYYSATLAVSLYSGFYTDTDWHHIAFARNGDSLTVVVDGVLKDTESFVGKTANNSANDIVLGKQGMKDSFYFSGYIDELIIVDSYMDFVSLGVPTEPY